MSSNFDAMQQGLNIVENHLLSSDPDNSEVLRVLEALIICVDDLHDLDHEMQGQLNRHPGLFESFRYLRRAMSKWQRAEDMEDNDG